MTTIKAFFKRHPLASYLIMTFAISWGGIFMVVGPGRMPADEEQAAKMLVLSYIAMLAGPSVAGILLTGILDGMPGLREYGSRLLKWRVGARWYSAALLTAPFLISVVLLALSLISPDFTPRLFIEDDKAILLQFSFVAGLMVGVFEELGWTGFVMPRMGSRYSVLKTGLVVGFMYTVWNFPVVFWVSTATGTAGTLPMIIFMPITLFTWLPTYRVLMVWIYDHTESLLVAMLMHTSLIVFWTALTPMAITGMGLVTYYLIFTAAMWVVIAIVFRLQSLRQPVQRYPASESLTRKDAHNDGSL